LLFALRRSLPVANCDSNPIFISEGRFISARAIEILRLFKQFDGGAPQPYVKVCWPPETGKEPSVSSAALRPPMAERNAKERQMISKVLSGAVIAGLLMAVSAPVVAYADEMAAPKTKADCKKATGMKWDKKTKTCMKK
jgi:hypothetical protein